MKLVNLPEVFSSRNELVLPVRLIQQVVARLVEVRVGQPLGDPGEGK